MRVCARVSGQTGGSSLPRWSAAFKETCQLTPWVARAHILLIHEARVVDMGMKKSKKHLCSALASVCVDM